MAAILFYPSANYLEDRIANGRNLNDNDYDTFGNASSYTLNIRRNNAATKVTHVWLVSSGVSSYRINVSPSITRTISNSFVNKYGNTISRLRHGRHWDLFELPTILHESSINISFSGSSRRIYELACLEMGYELDIDSRFVSESHRKIDRAEIVQGDQFGYLTRSSRRGSNRWSWISQYQILFEDGNHDEHFAWLEKNPNIFFAPNTEYYPNRVYPATVMQMEHSAQDRSIIKSQGSVVNFTIAENTGLLYDQITSQDNAAPVVPSPSPLRSVSSNSVIGRITISWRAPENADESRVRSYEWREAGGSWNNIGNNLSFVVDRNVQSRTYNFEIRAIGASGRSAVSSVSVQGQAIPRSSTVRSLSATAPTYNTILIQFTEPSNADAAAVTHYLYRIGTTGNYTRIDRGDRSTYSITRTEITGRSTAYTIQVIAVGASGNSAIASDSVIVSNRPAPTVPRNLEVTSPTYNIVRIEFDASSNAVDAQVSKYQYRRMGISAWTDAPSFAFNLPDEISGGTYTYQVRAVGVIGNSVHASDSVTVLNHPLPTAPRSPALDVSTKGSVLLTFGEPANAAAAEIKEYSYREAVAEDETPNAWVSTGTSRSVRIPITESRSYTYEIRARGTSGWGTDYASVTGEGEAFDIPGEARSLQLDSPGNNNIRIRVNPPSNRVDAGVTGYEYLLTTDYDDDTDEEWVAFGNAGSGQQSVTFGGSLLPLEHEVSVRVVGPSGVGDSIMDDVMVTTDRAAPNPARSLTLLVLGYNRLQLSWSDSTTADVVWYEYKESSETAWTRHESPVNLTMVPEGRYIYQVRAFGLGGYSGAASSNAATVSDPPEAPSALRMLTSTPTADEYYEATVSWQEPANIDEAILTRYQWRRQTGVDDENMPVYTAWTTTGNSGADTSFTISTLINNVGTTFNVEVQCVAAGGSVSGIVSVSGTARPLPLAVATFTATPIDDGMRVTWTAPSNAAMAQILGYDIKRSTSTTWTRTTALTADFDIEPAGTYMFNIVPIGFEGRGPQSNAAGILGHRPGAPRSVTADIATAGEATISFRGPANRNRDGVTGYQYSHQTGTNLDDSPIWSNWSDTFTARKFTVSHPNGGEFTYRIRSIGTRTGIAVATTTFTIQVLGPEAVENLRVSFRNNRFGIAYSFVIDGTEHLDYEVIKIEYKPAGGEWTNLRANDRQPIPLPERTNIGTLTMPMWRSVRRPGYTVWVAYLPNPVIAESYTFRVQGRYDDGTTRYGVETTVSSSASASPPDIPVPNPIRTPVVIPENRNVYIGWVEPEPIEGVEVVYYTVVATDVDDTDNTFNQTVYYTSAEMIVERNKTYDFVITPYGIAGAGESVTIQSPIPFAQPEMVTLTLNSTLAGQLYAFWTPPENSTQTGDLRYQYRFITESDWTDTTERSVSYINLPADDYTFFVRAVNESGVAGISTSGEITVAAPVPTRVEQLRHGLLTATTWPILWNAPENAVAAGITHYEVRVGSGGDWTDIGNVLSYTYTWLDTDNDVTLYVRAVGPSGASGIVEIANATGSTYPGVVPMFTADVSVAGELTVNWAVPLNVPPAVLTGYDMRIFYPNGAQYNRSAAADATSYTETGLSPGEYSVRIWARTSAGVSPGLGTLATGVVT